MSRSFKFLIDTTVVLLTILAGYLYWKNTQIQAVNEVCFKSDCFKVEIADNNQKREKGLSDRQALNPNSGMLFIFNQEDRYSFWMKNTQFSLDMIWLDKEKKVVFIQPDAPTCPTDSCPMYTPDKPALYVLELTGGLSSKIGVKIGDKVEFR